MALFANTNRLLEAAASADLLALQKDGGAPEVTDAVEELQDVLVGDNIEEVPADEMVTNGQPVTISAESCIVTEAQGTYRNGTKYLIEFSDIIRLMETETEGEENPETPDVAPEGEPDAGDLVEKVADACGVDKEDISIVISADECAMLAECALLEAKAGRTKKRATTKLNKFKRALRDMKKHGIKLVKAKKTSKKK